MEPYVCAKIYHLPTALTEEEIQEFDCEYGNEFTDEKLAEITEIINKEFPDIEVGDVIYTFPQNKQYRNQGVVLWNYNGAVNLEFFDEYGNVPNSFQVSKELFHPKYWTYAISHNNIFWLDSEYLTSLIQNMNYIEIFNHKVIYSIIDIKGELYCLVNTKLEDIENFQQFTDLIGSYEPLEWHESFSEIDLFHPEGNLELETRIKEKHNITQELVCMTYYHYD